VSANWWSWVGSSPSVGVPNSRGTMETMRLDFSAFCTPQSLISILSYISSYLASCFSSISSEVQVKGFYEEVEVVRGEDSLDLGHVGF
jgi:hypothetical protein